jgi:hypothetical protein
VDFDRKQATVTAVADRYDEKALLTALEKEGFQGTVVIEGGKS